MKFFVNTDQHTGVDQIASNLRSQSLSYGQALLVAPQMQLGSQISKLREQQRYRPFTSSFISSLERELNL